MKKILGPILLVVLVLGVVGAIFISARDQLTQRNVVTVRGLIGSEKRDFFQDPQVIAAFRQAGLDVQIETAGSRLISTRLAAGEYDFGFPAGIPGAAKIRDTYNVNNSYEIFFTPMVIAAWQPIVEVLMANGVVVDQGGTYMFDMQQFLDLFAQEVRWSDLQANTVYNVNKTIMISSTDVRTSNSAAMYLSLASYVANNDNIVQNERQIDPIMPLMTDLFLKQGFQAGSSAGPFQDYLTMGMGKAPLVMIYESQFIYQQVTGGGIRPEMVLLYSDPTLYTWHVLVSLTERGDRLGKLLRKDPDLQQDEQVWAAANELERLAIEHGYRNTNIDYFQQFVRQHNLNLADNLVNVVNPPSFEVIEEMITRIERQY